MRLKAFPRLSFGGPSNLTLLDTVLLMLLQEATRWVPNCSAVRSFPTQLSQKMASLGFVSTIPDAIGKWERSWASNSWRLIPRRWQQRLLPPHRLLIKKKSTTSIHDGRKTARYSLQFPFSKECCFVAAWLALPRKQLHFSRQLAVFALAWRPLCFLCSCF